MSAWIAVIDLLDPSVLKKYALLFDAFTGPIVPFYTSTTGTSIKEHEQSQAEITWLYENGIILDFSHEKDLNFKSIFRSSALTLIPEGMDINILFDEFRYLSEKFETGETPEQIVSDFMKKNSSSPYEILNHRHSGNVCTFIEFFKGAVTLLGYTIPDTVRLMAGVLRDTQKLNAYPLLDESLKIFQSEPKKGRHDEDVLSVILKRLPEPDDSVPWEQIIEYRTDPASKGKLLALRNWTHEMVRSELTQQEIEDKLDWLIYDYQRHLKLYKIKYNVGTLETVVTVGAQFLEDMVKFKWGDAAKALFSLKLTRVLLLEAEMGNPGSEIAYLVETEKAFT